MRRHHGWTWHKWARKTSERQRLRRPEVEEDAREFNGRRMTAVHLQKELTKLVDCTRLRSLESVLRQQGSWDQPERLQEIRHPGVSRRWLWHQTHVQVQFWQKLTAW